MAGDKGSGGRRAGAGRKPKPLAEKILEGKKDIKTIQFDTPEQLRGEEIPKPRDYLTQKQKMGELIAADVRREVWNWLKDRRCEHLIPMLLVDQFSMKYARWIQAERAWSEYGPLSRHPTTGQATLSPFIGIAQTESKAALGIWTEIYSIVRANCSSDGWIDEDDPMEKLLREGDRGRWDD